MTRYDYGGVVRELLRAYKDGDRRDLAPLLAGELSSPLAVIADRHCRRSRSALTVVPVPSSAAGRRRRGDAPLRRLAQLAGRHTGLAVADVLAVVAPVADQAGLGHEERLRNLAGSMQAQVVLTGHDIVLVDDILTSGATLAEAARACRAAGASVRAAATIAATRRTGWSNPIASEGNSGNVDPSGGPPSERPFQGW